MAASQAPAGEGDMAMVPFDPAALLETGGTNSATATEITAHILSQQESSLLQHQQYSPQFSGLEQQQRQQSFGLEQHQQQQSFGLEQQQQQSSGLEQQQYQQGMMETVDGGVLVPPQWAGTPGPYGMVPQQQERMSTSDITPDRLSPEEVLVVCR
jgi:hypothetical protein